MNWYLAIGLAVTVGFWVGRTVGVRQTERRLAADPPHRHEWGRWEDVPIEVHPTWDGLRIGSSYSSDGQTRKCSTCGKSEIRRAQ